MPLGKSSWGRIDMKKRKWSMVSKKLIRDSITTLSHSDVRVDIIRGIERRGFCMSSLGARMT